MHRPQQSSPAVLLDYQSFLLIILLLFDCDNCNGAYRVGVPVAQVAGERTSAKMKTKTKTKPKTKTKTICGYGIECCCCECSFSYECECMEGSYQCLHTEFCFRPPGCDVGARGRFFDREGSDLTDAASNVIANGTEVVSVKNVFESGVAPIVTTVKNKKNENSKKRKKTKRGDGRVRRCVPKGKIMQEGGVCSIPICNSHDSCVLASKCSRRKICVSNMEAAENIFAA